MHPTLGETVIYRSRTGNYSVPAIVTATRDSLHRPGVEAGFVPDLTDETCVHLSVLTPGLPGKVVGKSAFVVESEHGRSENVGGLYQEWDIPFNDEDAPGTWRHR